MFTERGSANLAKVADRRVPDSEQHRVYVPPGDISREVYRLSTFKNYPTNVRIDLRIMAASGFYFTGYRDRVVCFSCGQTTENWQPEDDPRSREWHDQSCAFVRGEDTTNISIQSLLQHLDLEPRHKSEYAVATRNEFAREQTVASTLTNNQNSLVSRTPVADQFHHKPNPGEHSGLVRPALQHTRLNVAVPNDSTLGESSTSQTQEDLFSCLYPINPHMRNEDSRLQTFLDHALIWPAHRIKATPKDIAEAGMYYLGIRDRVKCWYCNGGLQNWDAYDIPWVEHAKWFPMCEFVLKKKGVQFVHSIVVQFPGLERPPLYNPCKKIKPFPGVAINRRQDSSQTSSFSRPAVVDPKEEEKKRKKQIKEDMKSSEFVTQAKKMGFTQQNVKNALKKQYEQFDAGFSCLEDLLEAIFSQHEECEETKMDKSFPSAESSAPRSSAEGSGLEIGARAQLTKLEEVRKCKICHSELANIVFVPCGHLSCCASCSEKIEKCPLCNCFIRQKIRSYIT